VVGRGKHPADSKTNSSMVTRSPNFSSTSANRTLRRTSLTVQHNMCAGRNVSRPIARVKFMSELRDLACGTYKIEPMGNWYRVRKTIDGRYYDYWQRTERHAAQVKTFNKYVGPTGAAPTSALATATLLLQNPTSSRPTAAPPSAGRRVTCEVGGFDVSVAPSSLTLLIAWSIN
jgi:hypothetical protein